MRDNYLQQGRLSRLQQQEFDMHDTWYCVQRVSRKYNEIEQKKGIKIRTPGSCHQLPPRVDDRVDCTTVVAADSTVYKSSQVIATSIFPRHGCMSLRVRTTSFPVFRGVRREEPTKKMQQQQQQQQRQQRHR